MMLNLTEALRGLTPKAHTDSTRFNKKKLWKFVLIYGCLWLTKKHRFYPFNPIFTYYKKSVSMDFKLDKIGVYFYNSRAAAVR